MFARVFYLKFRAYQCSAHFTESNVRCSSLLSANMQSKPKPPPLLELCQFYQQRREYMWNSKQGTEYEGGRNSYFPDQEVIRQQSTVQFGRRAGSIRKASSQNDLREMALNQNALRGEVRQKKAQLIQQRSKQAARETKSLPISEVIPHGARRPAKETRWMPIMQTSEESVRGTTSVSIQQPSGQPARETKRLLNQITSEKASSERRLVLFLLRFYFMIKMSGKKFERRVDLPEIIFKFDKTKTISIHVSS